MRLSLRCPLEEMGSFMVKFQNAGMRILAPPPCSLPQPLLLRRSKTPLVLLCSQRQATAPLSSKELWPPTAHQALVS